jgi:hypothetical protein
MVKSKKSQIAELLKLPSDEPGVVNILIYKGTVYGVYARHDDAYAEGVKRFGESAMAFLDGSIVRQKVL